MRQLWHRVIALFTALTACAALAGCAGGSEEDPNTLTVWTFEGLPQRVQVQKQIFRRFTKQTGIEVKLVTVAQDQFSQLLSSSAAAGELPDVIGATPLAGIWEMHANNLLDTQAASSVVGKLGRGTFSKQALDLVTDGGALLAVPSDAWTQLIVYRKDLFEKAGLAPPETYADLRRAAATLSKNGSAGISLATDPGDVFTQQSFEHVALANGCELTDAQGNVSLNTPQCAKAFDFYAGLASQYSVRGSQDIDSTRATYFAGESAMMIWSSFILDEMAGLRNDALPTCGPCKDDPDYLAKNSGVVTELKGPSGQSAQYGEIVSWGITKTANTTAAKKFVRHMMTGGYMDWLSMAPEGKIPAREGTQKEPEKFVEAWSELEVGVDKKKSLSSIYSDEVIEELLQSPDTISRWGLSKGQGRLVGAMQGELPVPKVLNAAISGGLSGKEAAKNAQAKVETIKSSLD